MAAAGKVAMHGGGCEDGDCTDKKENLTFLIYIRKFRVEQLQSHI
jgi:hypothetical protein